MSSSLIESIASLSEADRKELLSSLTEKQANDLLWDWLAWARPEQIAPPGEWLTWLILAGRGFGKTRSGAEWTRSITNGSTPLGKSSHSRLAIIAETAADARDVLVEGDSGILSVHPKDFRPLYEPSKRRLTWPNGATATLFNATEPDQLRGPQFDAAWSDEIAKWQYAQETYDMLSFGLRLGDDIRHVVTTTPRPIPVIKEIIAESSTIVTKGSTYDNRANLSAKFFTKVVSKYEGTRLGRQELNAEILDDLPGALWTRALLDRAKVRSAPELQRIVVSVDPSGQGDNGIGDSIGIIVAGLGVDGLGYILADRSCDLPPSGWGRRAVEAYHEFGANCLVAEKNFGGAMVEHVIRTVDLNVAFKAVTASRGKVARAEPISAFYDQDRVRHVGSFAELEDQMCQMAANGYIGKGSPDRLDAAVWALSDLMLDDNFEHGFA